MTIDYLTAIFSRHVPIVGSFYNWLLPMENNKIKGRSLNLNEGKLETTENIYKCQMQVFLMIIIVIRKLRLIVIAFM